MNDNITAELLRDALRNRRFLQLNYGVEVSTSDPIFSILCAFNLEDICKDYLSFKGEQ